MAPQTGADRLQPVAPSVAILAFVLPKNARNDAHLMIASTMGIAYTCNCGPAVVDTLNVERVIRVVDTFPAPARRASCGGLNPRLAKSCSAEIGSSARHRSGRDGIDARGLRRDKRCSASSGRMWRCAATRATSPPCRPSTAPPALIAGRALWSVMCACTISRGYKVYPVRYQAPRACASTRTARPRFDSRIL